VHIKKKEVGKKNGSVWSKSKGNEAATRSFGMDVVSHTISGASKHQAYSFDVLFEKAGAERFMDLTTTNHGSDPATAMQIDKAGVGVGSPASEAECKAMDNQNDDDFKEAKSKAKEQPQKRFERAKSDDQPGITIAQAKVPGGMRSGTSSATVREVVPKFSEPPNNPLNTKPVAEGGQRTKVDGKGRYAMDICPPKGSADYHHPTGMEHAEIHIFNSVAGLGGPSRPALTFAIQWRESFKGKLTTDSPRRDACPVCQKAIAHACACFAIYICNEDGEAEPQCPQDKPAADTDAPMG
jgi:hypothetical protein